MKKNNVKGVPLSNLPIDPNHKLALAINKIDWISLQNSNELFKKGFKPIQPVRRIFGLLVLESTRGLSGDELLQQWLEIPIFQYFTGEDWFHWELPITNKEIEDCKTQISSKGIEILNSMIDEVNKI
jgi:IS5 family transposase